MKTLNGQELELFRAGDYGAKGTYTPEDLKQLADGYDPARHEVPLVIGHPKLNAPAFGWQKKLRAQGDTLFGTFDQAVQQGLYKKRSIALARTPDGKLDLRHVGYLEPCSRRCAGWRMPPSRSILLRKSNSALNPKEK